MSKNQTDMMNRWMGAKVFAPMIIVSLIILFSTGCKKEETQTGAPPVISGVSYLDDRDNDLPSVNYGDWIFIKGNNLGTTHKIEFNNIAVPDSLFYAEETAITVKIPAELPDPSKNPITVYTNYGITTYDFKILQPAPVFESFSQVGGNPGDVIKLFGNYFKGTESVRFGDIEAEIVSASDYEISVKVPTGFQFGYITITTPSGTVTSDRVFGFQYLLFGEEMIAGWWNGSFGGTSTESTEQARSGSKSLKFVSTGAWGAAKYGKNGEKLDMTGHSGFKVSLFGGPGTDNKKVKIMLNGVTDKGYEVFLKEGAWVDYDVPLINLGKPDGVETVTLQEFSGNKSDFYLDDIGFY